MTFDAMCPIRAVIKFFLFVIIAVQITSASSDVVASTFEGPIKILVEPSVESLASAKHAWVSAIGSDRVDQLVQLGNEYALSELLEYTASNGKSALMVAAKKGDLALAKSLVAQGASVHETTVTNGTAFMFAILGNQSEMAEWLYEASADINVVGSNGWTALTIAAAKGNADLLQWLLDRGADGQTRDVYRYTPLLRAVENGYIETATILLTLPKTDVNAQDEYDNTALHHAISSSNVSMIRLLLANRARSDIDNRKGLSAQDLASGINTLISELLRSQ